MDRHPGIEGTGPAKGGAYVELPVPVPPMLEATLHYKGNDPFLGLVYSGNDLCLLTRTYSCGGASVGWAGLQTFLQHPLMSAVLRKYHLYDEEAAQPPHGLVLDRERRQLLVGPAEGIWDFIRGPVRTEATPVDLSEEELQALTEGLKTLRPFRSQIYEAMSRDAKLLEELKAWMRQTLDPLWEGVLAELGRPEGAP